MKIKRLTYDEWTCITSKIQRGDYFKFGNFSGYIGLLEINAVSEVQKWYFNNQEIVVCDSGIKWLSILPDNDYYSITAMMNENDEILLWYIDMIASQDIDDDNIPWFYDLYLDLVVYPNGDIITDDMDELIEALNTHIITRDLYELAIATSNKLKNEVLYDIISFKKFTKLCYEKISNQ